jgi:hypothetical protein
MVPLPPPGDFSSRHFLSCEDKVRSTTNAEHPLARDCTGRTERRISKPGELNLAENFLFQPWWLLISFHPLL